MYFFKLEIAIISQNTNLQELIYHIDMPKDIGFHVATYSDKWREGVQDAQLIFLNLPHDVLPEQVRINCKTKAKIIVCAEPTDMAGLTQESMQAVDAFWIKPLNAETAAIQLARLIEQVRLYRRMNLYKMFLNALIESMPDMVWFKDLDGAHVKVNDAFCHVVGKTKQDITNRDHCYIWDVSKEEFERGEFVCKETDQYVLEQRMKCVSTEEVKSQQGMRQFNTYKAPLITEDGELWGTVGIGHDVTDLKNMGAELEIILRSMPFAILLWNADGIIIGANDKFEEYFHLNKNAVIGIPYNSWKYSVLEEIKSTDGADYPEAKLFNSDPEREKTLEIHEETILDVFHNVVGKLSIYRDITKERELERQILDSSNTDFLTGLYNRRYFYQFIRENREAKQISLMYVDLDQFKKVNDTFGHQAGDEALIVTARLLTECFADDFIARIGGDEFLIAILGSNAPEILEQKACHLLERMRQVFSSYRSLEILSASIGIAQSDQLTIDIDILLQHSDDALYQAKTSGKSRYCFYVPKS